MEENNHVNQYWILTIENITRPSSDSLLIIFAWFLSGYTYQRKIKQINNIPLLWADASLEIFTY